MPEHWALVAMEDGMDAAGVTQTRLVFAFAGAYAAHAPLEAAGLAPLDLAWRLTAGAPTLAAMEVVPVGAPAAIVPVDMVTFVVCPRVSDAGVVEILMVQERTGEWFLPAGHVDPGETFVCGGIRECREEAGVEVELTGLLTPVFCATDRGYSPLHFVLVGRQIGGALKTVADHESLGAAYFPLAEVLHDIGSGREHPQAARKYRKAFEIGPFVAAFASRFSVADDTMCPVHHRPFLPVHVSA